jgi:aspartate/methionine/tyrosine aminotransferase
MIRSKLRLTDRLPNLTQYERVGISRELNLADGHAHQSPDHDQRMIVTDLPDLYLESELIRQETAEVEFQRAFYRLAGQHSAMRHPQTVLCYSASMSIDIVAAYLHETGMSVGLVQPCFDNLAAILRRRGVPLVPIAEEALIDASWLAGPGKPDALFVTLPNNPTGFTLGPAEFEQLASWCAASGTVLIVDWTFRFFDRDEPWDQYEVLDRTGVSYFCVEDTGKTWPTLDLKCSILATSADHYGLLLELHNDLLLNVSPFILRLLLAYIEDAQRRGLDMAVRWTVATNRRTLHWALRDSVLVPGDPGRTISVEWVRIASVALRSLDVVDMLAELGIGILPGDHFYWYDPHAGSNHIRIALARDTTMFATACLRLRAAIDTLPLLRETGVR